MKPALEPVEHEPNSSFAIHMIEREQRTNFSASYHYHPEYELIWTVSSQGTRYVGNQVSDYQPDELIFLGKNIPHCWITKEKTQQIVFKIKDDVLDVGLMESPEFQQIRKMLANSYRGIEFHGATKASVKSKITALIRKKPILRILDLLAILDELASSEDFNYINAEDYKPRENKKEMGRIQTIYNFILSRIDGKVDLEEAAREVSMTKSSFCKFVKRRTGKTFNQIVNEIRINRATELLINSDQTVTEIAFMTGYNDLSTFFRQFKTLRGVSPNTYRHQFE
ncbi:MAG: AraC family transcriptional regulator [Bacteroidota bacterium]